MGCSKIKVTYRVPARHCLYGYEYVDVIFAYDELDSLRSDPSVVKIVNVETGELLLRRF